MRGRNCGGEETTAARDPAGKASGTPDGTPAGRRRAAGIYGAIITASIMTAVGGSLPTLALALSVLVTLVVYCLGEEYAEVLGRQATGGHVPTWAHIKARGSPRAGNGRAKELGDTPSALASQA